MLVAAGLAGVYAESIPNFEILTLVVFGSGVLLGVRDGVLVGIVTELIYSVLNPYGSVHPLVTASQVTGEAIAGAAGGIFAMLRLHASPFPIRVASLVVCGAIVTIVFDLVTNLATAVLFGQIRATLIAGIPFALWHLVWNVVLFAALGPPMVGVFGRYRARLASPPPVDPERAS